ncbi:hypothetical protein SAMN04488074_101768 [Lentzea albidocapillata subsp. violacea]|uniref:Tetratricopeptide repeat-containing protein n=2 Tax=Lentzea albidocapillata TaxID=40571 RepID=A0A1G8RS00_9PSEU|nr:hypothetical protein SAMN04488074_101768 [Lentzea albidocapillata subsp. violacea]
MDTLVDPPRYPIMTMLWGMALGAPQGDSQVWHRRVRLLGDDPWSAALALAGDGLVARLAGDPAAAADLLARAAAAFTRIGDRWGAALAFNQLGEIALTRGDAAGALVHIERGRGLLDELGATEDTAEAVIGRAQATLLAGDFDGARTDFGVALTLARRAGALVVQAGAHLGLAELARVTGDYATARQECDQAWERCPGGWYGPDQLRCHIAVERGRVAKAEGDVVLARRHFEEALRRAVGQRDHVTETAVRVELAALPAT